MKQVKRSFCEMPFVVLGEGQRTPGKIDRLCEIENETSKQTQNRLIGIGLMGIIFNS